MSHKRSFDLRIGVILALVMLLSWAGARATAPRPSDIASRAHVLARVASASAAVTPAPTGATPTRTAPPLSLTLTLLFTCCALGLVVGVIVLGFAVGVTNRPKAEKTGKASAGKPNNQ